MKKILFIIFFIFIFQSWPKADDARDFEIERMSVGDSLLNYLEKWNMTEQQIIDSKKFYYPASKKFYGLKVNIKSGDYDNFGFLLKSNDKDYIIYILRGKKDFPNNLTSCKKYKKKIVQQFETIFKDLKKDDYTHNYRFDDGDSISHITSFKFEDNSAVRVYCDDWSPIVQEERGWNDQLVVEISLSEALDWINNEAYN